MRALVTGASGFLGARLAHRLARAGWATTALLRHTSSTAALDQAGPAGALRLARLDAEGNGLAAILAEARPDVVLHTAAVSRSDDSPRDTGALVRANVLFPAMLLAEMRAAGCTALVNTGTSWQTAEGPGFSPFNLYAATKQACEDLIAGFCLDGLRAVTLRLFDTYGPGDTRGKIADLVIRAAITGTRLAMSPGGQVIDLCHVDDVAEAFVRAAARVRARAEPGHEVFGVQGERIVLRDLAALVGRLAGRDAPIEWGGRPYRPREIMQPFAGLPALPGWSPAIGLEPGIAAQVAAMRAALTPSAG